LHFPKNAAPVSSLFGKNYVNEKFVNTTGSDAVDVFSKNKAL